MFCPATVTKVACVVATTFASATVRSGTFAVKSLEIVSAPFSPYLTPSPVTLPAACSSRLLPVTVASNLAMPVDRLVDQLADLLEARRVGVDLQVRLAGVVQRQRAARLDVDVAADDLERADVAGRVAIRAVDVRARDLEAADRRRLERRPSRRPARCRASRRSRRSRPSRRRRACRRRSLASPGLPLATAGSKPAKLPFAFTCAVSRAMRARRNRAAGSCRRGSTCRSASRSR